jgi:hypothetical protein
LLSLAKPGLVIRPMREDDREAVISLPWQLNRCGATLDRL